MFLETITESVAQFKKLSKEATKVSKGLVTVAYSKTSTDYVVITVKGAVNFDALVKFTKKFKVDAIRAEKNTVIFTAEV